MKKKWKHFIKSVAPIGKNSKYFSEKPYGARSCNRRNKWRVSRKYKKRVNADILIVKDGEIVLSTIFNGSQRVTGKLGNERMNYLMESILKIK